MRTFEGNLNSYHALNALTDLKAKEFQIRLNSATTDDEIKQILEESMQYFDRQTESYRELGTEMNKIINKRWWEFWK